MCHAFATEGASVVVTDLNNQGIQETVDSLPKHSDNRHSSYSLDVTSGDEIRKVLEYIINGYRKPPCVLVNSAGITSDDFLLKMDEEKFDKVIDVNLKVRLLINPNCHWRAGVVQWCVHSPFTNNWPGFDCQSHRHKWTEFVGCLLFSERFFPGNFGFPWELQFSPGTTVFPSYQKPAFDWTCCDSV